MNDTIISLQDLKVHFPIKQGIFQHTTGYIRAVDGISLDIRCGEALSLVGESGCGKTTVGRAIVRLNEPCGGRILYNGENMLDKEGEQLRQLRKKLQIVFQDPYSSLNPRQTVKRLIGEILTVQMGMTSQDASAKTLSLLKEVGLSSAYADRYPHEFSGGQRQRVAIAKAIALEPDFLVCDEAVSALDASIQSQIINLLMDLKEAHDGMTYLFISHALNVVQHISDRVAVMYLGKIMECADTDELFGHAAHPYTKALFSAIPIMAGRGEFNRIVLKGEVPSASAIPSGCRFHTRCPYAKDICASSEPPLREIAPNHLVSCHFESL